MTRSQLLKDFVCEQESLGAIAELGEACDMTSTGGYDNDGSIGPEMVDNGIGLGMAALRYDSAAVVFFAFGAPDSDQQCYYQFGKDEADALRRLRETFALLD
jgi:hypothetical protein